MMKLKERKFIDQLEVLSTGTVQVREVIEIVKGTSVISKSYHRYVIGIDDESPDLSMLDEDSLLVVQAARTPKRIAAAKERRLTQNDGEV